MTELEVCRLTAKAFGRVYDPSFVPDPYDEREDIRISNWNPLTNAEQRWECVEWLDTSGYNILLATESSVAIARTAGPQANIAISCHKNEFPARAVAEIQKRKTT